MTVVKKQDAGRTRAVRSRIENMLFAPPKGGSRTILVERVIVGGSKMRTSNQRFLKRRLAHNALFAAIIFFVVLSLPLPCVHAEEQESIETLRKLGKAFAGIAEKASKAVVGIKVEKTTVQQYYTIPDWPFGQPFDPFEDDLFDWFFRRDYRQRRPRQREFRQTAQGSGFIISTDGYILTNNHVVGEADKITVKLAEGRELSAKLVGTDPESDIALIKVDSQGLPFLELADSDAIEVGEWVVAIGNPFGLSHTVTAGIISATGRSNVGLTTYEDFIQTDAAINPGNSGGPLINLDGKVIGINTAIIGPGGNVGIGFAIPINMAKAIYPQLKEAGSVVRGYLGVGIQDLTPDFIKAFGLDEDTKGVLVPEVQEGSAAEQAGLEAGDVIVEFNGEPVATAHELQNKVALERPGTKVKVVVLRGGKKKTFTVELGERPKAGAPVGSKSQPLEKLGFRVTDLTDELAKRLGYEGQSGVVVTNVEPGSVAANVGLAEGTLILEVNRKPVTNTEQFNEAMAEAMEKGSPMLLIRQGRRTFYLIIPVPED